MTLTDAQFKRLPALLQDIVVADRCMPAIRRMISDRVPSIGQLRIAREHLRRRQELTAAAAQVWGHRLSGEGPARC
ncbi:hypothetical protein MMB17_07420 [Methylobacterium organophilum]|uniref:hypothetical protein n=1 Tax=Methylobacterium organophilum TaxID=410 RepID=UPI001F12A037|nr:hypothetical protein [Methylobacterium organophilum]UMY19119.1 hypothetical protein MMB17_07420 [Methylobacterium organophilum]